MSKRYTIATASVLVGSVGAATFLDSFWPAVAGVWLACLPAVMIIFERESKTSNGS